MYTEKIGGTTWFVYPRSGMEGQYENKIGTVNYPGTGTQPDKSKKHHAVLKDGTDLGHFGSLDEAVRAICRREPAKETA